MFQDQFAFWSEIEGFDPDFIDQYCDENAYKDQNANVSAQSKLAERCGPDQNESSIEIEDHEKDGNQIKMGGEPEPGITRWRHPGFIWFIGRFFFMSFTEKIR